MSSHELITLFKSLDEVHNSSIISINMIILYHLHLGDSILNYVIFLFIYCHIHKLLLQKQLFGLMYMQLTYSSKYLFAIIQIISGILGSYNLYKDPYPGSHKFVFISIGPSGLHNFLLYQNIYVDVISFPSLTTRKNLDFDIVFQRL